MSVSCTCNSVASLLTLVKSGTNELRHGYEIPAELSGKPKEDAVHPYPLTLNVHYYEKRDYRLSGSLIPLSITDRILPLRDGFYKVATDDNHKWVIGVYMLETLCPLMAPRKDLRYEMGRVKVRIIGNTASETAPLLNEYHVNLRMFIERLGDPETKKENIRFAQVSRG
ncbi:uncharacterized protein LOC117182918 [Belonocnema kinseyi]|uniref:uncharacterized protein LOC117182918 n=1 Tax=Belonocnema kinseyi TaxID=2817044 RepID=UPI00143D72F4|nr:uncharacterized protein LOC117182918 [Belonocnema kinseyi]